MSFLCSSNHGADSCRLYEIEQYELHTSKYRVRANSEGEALAKLFAGEGEPVDQSQEFVEVADDYGLPADEFPELVQELAKLGVTGCAADVMMEETHA